MKLPTRYIRGTELSPEFLGQVEQTPARNARGENIICSCAEAWVCPQVQLQLLFLQRLGLSHRIWLQTYRFEPILINLKSQGYQKRDSTELKLIPSAGGVTMGQCRQQGHQNSTLRPWAGLAP